MKTIIVTTDFSKGAENCVKYAKKLANSFDSKLILVHAYSPPIIDPNIPIGMLEETFKDTVDNLEQVLKKEVEDAISEGLNAEYKLSFSDLTSIINDITEIEKDAVVVIGKTGHKTFLDKLIGSTANHLIDNIHVPLIMIPENYEGEIMMRLAYASQLEYDEEKFIEKAISFAKKSPLGLDIIHINEKNELNINPDERFIKSIEAKFINEKIQIIQSESDSLKEGLNDTIKKEGISLIFLTTHKRGFLSGLLNPSKTKQIISSSNIPVGVFSFDD
ncbi:universal stress protein [Lacihabitans sp. LS3-19]|uniref:universal stress protein n=1 Tax=Lacihabitans sp. LS3-19 TaxID=2487335 RepID=UPI0020CBD6CD|nr:universal stress protein [Lacihabitans sp. LS3-19]MCP9767011.1 universal stress protein [Lacihabitans sp. LS3-19]